jgi:hypothetical protein
MVSEAGEDAGIKEWTEQESGLREAHSKLAQVRL